VSATFKSGQVQVWGESMREEVRQELQRKIAAKFEQALGPKPPAPKQISEERRIKEQEVYVETLYRAAIKQLRYGKLRPRG
jgi:hypothetical protein